jgi:hypothetical protein
MNSLFFYCSESVAALSIREYADIGDQGQVNIFADIGQFGLL